jgi:hypothetical protein
VKQDASPEEIAAVVDDAVAGSNQIFAQAVCIVIMITTVPLKTLITGFVINSVWRSENCST